MGFEGQVTVWNRKVWAPTRKNASILAAAWRFSLHFQEIIWSIHDDNKTTPLEKQEAQILIK